MQYSFDASQVDPAQGVEVWPDNTWAKVIMESHKPVPLANDDKAGRLLWTMRCIEGPLAGKLQFLGMNLWHGDEATRKRAEGELSALTWVTIGANQGRLKFGDFTELQNIPFYILSVHQAGAKAGDPPRQNFRGFKDVNGNDPGKAPGQQAPQQAPAFGQPAPGGFPGAPAPAQQLQPAPAFGQQPAPAAAPGFAPQAAPGFPQQAPAFAPPAAAPAGFAPGGFPGAPPAQAAPPAFGQPQPAPFAAPGGPGPAAAPGGFQPPGQPAGAIPWQR